MRCRAWISRRFLNNQAPNRTPTRICTSSLSADADQMLGLSARCVVGLIVKADVVWKSVNYLKGMLVMFHKDDANSNGEDV
jgi:hypothetical protein